MKFKSHYNVLEDKGETPVGSSLTIPEQSMSLREILKRFSAGLPLGGQRVPLYEGEDLDGVDLSHMDEIDRIQFAKDIKEELAEIKGRINQAQAEEIANKKLERMIQEREKAQKHLPIEKPSPNKEEPNPLP